MSIPTATARRLDALHRIGGVADEEIARRSGVDSDAVRRWRNRFTETGVAGVGTIAKGRGRKPRLAEGTVAEVVWVTQHEAPPGADVLQFFTIIDQRVSRRGVGRGACRPTPPHATTERE